MEAVVDVPLSNFMYLTHFRGVHAHVLVFDVDFLGIAGPKNVFRFVGRSFGKMLECIRLGKRLKRAS